MGYFNAYMMVLPPGQFWAHMNRISSRNMWFKAKLSFLANIDNDKDIANNFSSNFNNMIQYFYKMWIYLRTILE